MASNRGGYNWEQVTGRSWDVIEEDEHGRIKALDADPSARRRRGAAAEAAAAAGRASVRRGMIRYLFVGVDLSNSVGRGGPGGAAGDADFRPNRLSACVGACAEFFDEV